MTTCQRQKVDPSLDQSKFMPICPLCADFPLSEENMRKILTTEEYNVMRLRQDASPTENRHFYVDFSEAGRYHCKGCNLELFSSAEKSDTSVSGLCEFEVADLASKKKSLEITDKKEVLCLKCNSYLGFSEATDRLCLNGVALQFYGADMPSEDTIDRNADFPFKLTDDQWRAKLDEVAYKVLRHAHTEQARTSELTDEVRKGEYFCAGCDVLLFKSEHKFYAQCGWPAFNQPATAHACGESFDYGRGFRRIEVHCSTCGGHLGHKFFDAPDQPGGQRYCINGVCLRFVPDATD